jgi:hypothetical protein
MKSLPYGQADNRAFFEAGKGLAMCLAKLGHKRLTREVIARLVQLDSSDPLRLRESSNVRHGGQQN